jgi:hypothetical protein
VSTDEGIIEFNLGEIFAKPRRVYYVITDEDAGDSLQLSFYYTNNNINGDEVESASLPFVSNLDGKYYYSCKYNYISSISSSSICCEDNDQLLVVENNNNEMVNSISATGTSGTLCWETIVGTLTNPTTYVVSFTDDDIDFQDGGLLVNTSINVSGTTFRFVILETGECYEGNLSNIGTDKVNIFRNLNLIQSDPSPTPILAPTPTPTPARNTTSVQGQLYYSANEDLLVSGNYLIDPQREPRLHSIESGISLVSTASYSISLCHSSPFFHSHDFDGTYFANGYNNSGYYGINCESNFGRPPMTAEGGVLIYKRNGNNLSQIQSLYPPYVANNRWHVFSSPKFSKSIRNEETQNNLIISCNTANNTGIFVYSRSEQSDTFSFQTTITESYNLSLLEANNGYLFMGGRYFYDSSSHQNVGVVKVHKQSSDGSSWTYLQDLPFPQENNAYFGYKVKAHGDTLIVSTFGEDAHTPSSYTSYFYSKSTEPLPHDKGSVYFYQLNDSGLYELKSYFTDLTGAAIGSVDIKDNVAVLGAMPSVGTYNLQEYGMPEEGFVYVFDKNTSTQEWSLRSDTIKSSEVQDYSYYPDGVYNFRGFGFTVALSDDASRLYVTAPVDRDADTGDQVGKIYDVSLNG